MQSFGCFWVRARKKIEVVLGMASWEEVLGFRIRVLEFRIRRWGVRALGLVFGFEDNGLLVRMLASSEVRHATNLNRQNCQMSCP